MYDFGEKKTPFSVKTIPISSLATSRTPNIIASSNASFESYFHWLHFISNKFSLRPILFGEILNREATKNYTITLLIVIKLQKPHRRPISIRIKDYLPCHYFCNFHVYFRDWSFITGRATKLENCGSETFCPPTPTKDRVRNSAPPPSSPIKEWKLCLPPPHPPHLYINGGKNL